MRHDKLRYPFYVMQELQLVFVGICILFCSCFYTSCSEDQTQLPPLTMEGKNTFGCLVNGRVWLPKAQGLGQGSVDADYTSGNFLSFGASNDDSDFQFVISDPILINKQYSLTDTASSRVFYGSGKHSSYCVYEDYNLVCGFVVLTKFDLKNRIVSGTFEFTTYNSTCGDTVKVTNGRFDIGEIAY